MTQDHNDEADLLPGTKPIGKFLGLRSRQVLYLVEKNRIPFFRLGSTIYSRKSTLRNWMSEQERLAAGTMSNAPASQEGKAA